MTKRIKGFVKIPYAILDRMMGDRSLTGCEWDMLMIAFIKTTESADEIYSATLTELSRLTGHSRSRCSETIKSLVEKKYIERIREGFGAVRAEYRIIQG
jgi:DNA-binding MarR family transcriptional regulator